MRFLKELPFSCALDEVRLACALWQTAPGEAVCELGDGHLGACETSGISSGTTDAQAPLVCARHFCHAAGAGDGVTNYTLVETVADTAS